MDAIRHENHELHEYLKGVKSFNNSYNYCYLVYMAVRLLECQRVLKDTGSLYLHCDPTMSHYLKIVLDCVFGEGNFRNEIIWCYSRPSAPKQRQLSRVHDVILWYSKGKHWVFNPEEIRQPYAESSKAREGYKATASKVAEGSVELHKGGKFPESWVYIPPLKGNSREATGYPTQKPLALLERIIQASSNEGDVVLDPFCGCATTCIAAERLNRQWIGIDVSIKSYELVKERLNQQHLTAAQGPPHFSTKTPIRGDDDERPKKVVYIISNPAFEGMYKVGIAANAKTRLSQYQTSDPDRGYKLEFEYPTTAYAELEKHIHKAFDNKMEWVKGNVEDIKAAIKNYQPPLETLP